MSFQPHPTRSGHISFALGVSIGLALLFLVDALLQQTAPSTLFFLLVGSILFLGLVIFSIYWSIVALTLDYRLNRNGLAIRWGVGQQHVPFHRVETILPGDSVTEPVKFRGLHLAGLRLGWGEAAGYRPLRFFTTTSLTNSLLVITPERGYVISPRHGLSFLEAWDAHRDLGATQLWQEQAYRKWPFNLRSLTDPLTWWLIGTAAFFCVTLLGYISLGYASFPPLVPIHYDAFGQADRIVEKISLFNLPALGSLVLGANFLLGVAIYIKEQVAAYLLWSTTVIFQLFLWVAVLTITL